MTADVVVLGYGGAGAAAAIAAHDAGARVLVLESSPEGGGNTLVSFGGFMYAEDPTRALTYLNALFDHSRSERDDRLVQTFLAESARTPAWLKSIDQDADIQRYGTASYPELPCSDAIKRYVVKGRNRGATGFAQNLWQLLADGVERKRQIPVLTRTRATRLVTDSSGAVTGVIAQGEDKELRIEARRGVVLATGGYEFDDSLLQNSVKGYPLRALGHPGNRGDGVRMAQKVGARLWHMNGVSCAFGAAVPGQEAAFLIAAGNPGQILVDRKGERFINEAAIERHAALLAVDHFDGQALSYPRIPCYLIFDDRTRRRGPISQTAGLGYAGIRHEWSKDNSVEIGKGWIVKGETPAGLARSLDMPEAALKYTVERWNAGVRCGEDRLFGRPVPKELELATIEKPPFYAMELYPSLLNTQGGPKRNEKAEVVDPFDEPIPGLYSAGELGSMWGAIYQGGGNIAEALAFGRIAGANAAKRP